MDKNTTRLQDFSDVVLYAVTPAKMDKQSLLQQAEKALEGGVDALQFRGQGLTDMEAMALCQELKVRCHEAKALFLINNRLDLALAVDADGLHIGQDDLPIEFVRETWGHRKILGVSTHSIPQALSAKKKGADYVSCGPLWATPTKPTYEPVGLKSLSLYKAVLKIPFVAIGGIDPSNLDQVLSAGATRVALVRALFNAENPQKVASEMKQRLVAKAVAHLS